MPDNGQSKKGVTFALRYYPEHHPELPEESLWVKWGEDGEKSLITYN